MAMRNLQSILINERRCTIAYMKCSDSVIIIIAVITVL